MIVYHVTPAANIPSIMEHGLIPQVGARSILMDESPSLFFFESKDAVENALTNWLGDAFDEDEALTILQVDVPEEWLMSTPAEYELVCTTVVPPRMIDKVMPEPSWDVFFSL